MCKREGGGRGGKTTFFKKKKKRNQFGENKFPNEKKKRDLANREHGAKSVSNARKNENSEPKNGI